jgi:hypothetical protein
MQLLNGRAACQSSNSLSTSARKRWLTGEQKGRVGCAIVEILRFKCMSACMHAWATLSNMGASTCTPSHWKFQYSLPVHKQQQQVLTGAAAAETGRQSPYRMTAAAILYTCHIFCFVFYIYFTFYFIYVLFLYSPYFVFAIFEQI